MKARDNGQIYVANYGWFIVYNETYNYQMYVRDYSGNATNSFEMHSGLMFSTKDRDNDPYYQFSCAIAQGGGYWYALCGNTNLNGRSGMGNSLLWNQLPAGSSYQATFCQMWIWC